MPPKSKVTAEAPRPLTEKQLAERDLELIRGKIRVEAGDRVNHFISQIAEAAKLIVTDPRQARIKFEEIYYEMKVEKTEGNAKKRAEAMTGTAENARVHYSGQVCTVISQRSLGHAVRLLLLTDGGELIQRVDPLRVQWVSSLKHPAPDPLPMPEKKKTGKAALPPEEPLPETAPPTDESVG